MSSELHTASKVEVLTVCLFVMIGAVRMKKNFTELHVMCRNESQLVQVSGYTHRYFNTDNYKALIDDLENSPIYCIWEKNCTIRKNKKRRQKWFEKYMRCLKNETTIYNLISDETLETSSKNVRIRELGDQTVIVRSHQNFPWNYKYCHADSIYSLNFKTEIKHLKMKVALQVLWSEISKTQELFVQHGDVKKPISEGSGYLEINVTDLKDVKLTFKTSYKTCEDSMERGFLLCMKFLSKDQQRHSICNEVMGNVTTEMPPRNLENRRRKKGKKKGKRRRRNRKIKKNKNKKHSKSN